MDCQHFSSFFLFLVTFFLLFSSKSSHNVILLFFCLCDCSSKTIVFYLPSHLIVNCVNPPCLTPLPLLNNVHPNLSLPLTPLSLFLPNDQVKAFFAFDCCFVYKIEIFCLNDEHFLISINQPSSQHRHNHHYSHQHHQSHL